MKVKYFSDGISFYNDIDNEVAFYSFLIDRITYYPGAYNNWHEVGCISIPIEDMDYIMNEMIKCKKENSFN